VALRVGALGAVVLVVCWLAGFAWFIRLTRQSADPLPPHVDGVVALTGGAGRVEMALHLLASGRAERLLITGIGGGTELGTLGRIAGVDTAPLVSRITLGRYAASTRGNGVETAAWAEQNRIRTLIVVTASYHMPRALAALRQALPDVQLLPLPVRPHAHDVHVLAEHIHPEEAEHDPAGERGPGLRLEASEYVKYLVTISGLSEWFPRREATAVPAAVPGAQV
ncbi:MAG TPA: YdcF family protein, partial [Rhodopila sp.]|nr:YdcF family protein [Rhodopila sp.]